LVNDVLTQHNDPQYLSSLFENWDFFLLFHLVSNLDRSLLKNFEFDQANNNNF